VKHADDFVPLAKEETVLRGMTAGIIQVRRTYAMKINYGEDNDNLKEVIRKTDYDKSQRTPEC
jgi:hypothetical protein